MSFLLFALAGLGGLPLGLLIVFGAAAVITLALRLASAHQVGHTVHRRVGRELHNMLKDAELEALVGDLRSVLSDLDLLLARFRVSQHQARIEAFLAEREVLAQYNAELRDAASSAVRKAQSFLSVPAHIIRCAEAPINIDDLEYLRGWLRERAEHLVVH